MIEQTKISQKQAMYFILSTGFGTIIFIHSAVADLSGREAWIAEIVGIFALIPLALWTLFLGRLAPGQTILEILETVAGKVIGKIIAGVYFLISVTVTA
ncbi:MAG: GerAB/ArcD/ProY family transporter, partial [Bacillota bacterium]